MQDHAREGQGGQCEEMLFRYVLESEEIAPEIRELCRLAEEVDLGRTSFAIDT